MNEFRAVYKGIDLTVSWLEGLGWRPAVQVRESGEELSEEGRTLVDPKLSDRCLTLVEAQDKACREATFHADGVEKSCSESGIVWREVSN
jgi:hypothetical protein